MKRILLLILIISPLLAMAQSDWLTQTSNTSNNLNSVYFINKTTGWAVGNGGSVLKTTDAGVTWVASSTQQFSGLQDVIFLDANRGWMVNDQGNILRTTTGGAAWKNLTSGSPLYGIDIQGEESTYEFGYAVGDLGNVYTTSDGENWQGETNIPTSNKLNDVFSMDFPTNYAWAVGSGGTIIHTGNTGITWKAQKVPVGTGNLNSVYFTTSELGLAVGDGGKIIKTTNRGATWTAITSGTGDNLNDVFFVSETEVGIVGDNGIVLVSENAGDTWQAEAIPGVGSTNLNALFFVRNDLGWVAGDGGKIYHFKAPTFAKIQITKIPIR